MPEAAVLKIPPDFPLDKAAVLGCGVITGVGAVINAARVKMGSSVAVFGCGGIGLNAIQGARIVGALRIIAVDVADQKLEYARTMGATHTINAARHDPIAAIQEITGGRGADYAFEAIGITETIEQAYAATRKMGTCVVIGVTRADVCISLNANEMVYAEKTIMGSLYGSSRPKIDLLNLIEMYRSGKLLLDELLTRTYPLQQINEAYAALERGEVARSLVLA
jgi:Zn-dependent alcohol dehydrogenase